MRYIEEAYMYICANDRCLYAIGKRRKKAASGYVAIQTLYECEDCSNCPYTSNCKRSDKEKDFKYQKKWLKKDMCPIKISSVKMEPD